MPYKVFAALYDDSDKGWVWVCRPDLQSRRTMRVSNPNAKRFPGFRRYAYCECRLLDHNFVVMYNEQKHTRKIDPLGSWKRAPATAYKGTERESLQNILVMSDWYRQALGNLEAGQTYNLEVTQRRSFSMWTNLRAGCHHPDPGVRASTRIGIWGTWLGIVGLYLTIAYEHHFPFGYRLAVVLGLIALQLGRGLR